MLHGRAGARRLRSPAVLLLALLAAALLAPAPARAQKGRLRGLDAYVTSSMRDWQVPGLALAVVHGDTVVYARGYGVRQVGDTARVDTHTLFAIGSNTKAFTTAALGMLVDEGKLQWDDPVTKYLPWFQLKDPWETRELEVRDLLTHRTGLINADFVWYGTDLTRDQILHRLRLVPRSSSFRSQFLYQNVMFLAAGQLIPAITGQSWDAFVRDSIFQPLGMRESDTSVDSLAAQSDVASPHALLDGKVTPIHWRNIDNVGPAGSINSSAADMAQWLRLWLGGGQLGGHRFLSPAVVQEMETPQTVIGNGELGGLLHALNPDSHFVMYGLGFFLQDYRGRKIVWHAGHIDGMGAAVGFIPESNVGVVVLSNLNQSWLPVGLMWRVFDAYLGAPPRDWSASVHAVLRRLESAGAAQEKAMEAARVTGTHPTLPLERYAGTYADSLYGEVQVGLENGRLVLRASRQLVFDLDPWMYDTFEARGRDPMLGTSLVTFELNAEGRPATLRISGLGTYHRVTDDSGGQH
jgi:CubicO group peptidase (beta-lactamase class C family)